MSESFIDFQVRVSREYTDQDNPRLVRFRNFGGHYRVGLEGAAQSIARFRTALASGLILPGDPSVEINQLSKESTCPMTNAREGLIFDERFSLRAYWVDPDNLPEPSLSRMLMGL